jgi:hypothetical protein
MTKETVILEAPIWGETWSLEEDLTVMVEITSASHRVLWVAIGGGFEVDPKWVTALGVGLEKEVEEGINQIRVQKTTNQMETT